MPGKGLVSLAGLVAVAAATRRQRQRPRQRQGATARAATSPDVLDVNWDDVSPEWEVDCFSRPVMEDGKKIWELLVTDKNAAYRRVAQMKPTRVNSVVVEKILAIFISEAKVKPKSIRFYRKVMKNMLTVALQNVRGTQDLPKLKILPSRNCHMLRRWLTYREEQVYPKMPGYIASPARRLSPITQQVPNAGFEELPEKMRFAQYAIMGLPMSTLASMKPGAVPGYTCNIPPSALSSENVCGILVMSTRAEFLVTQFLAAELCGMRVDADTNELLVDLGMDTTYKVAKVPLEDKESCREFEASKERLGGLHFVAVFNPVDGYTPNLPLEGYENESKGKMISGMWMCIDYGRDAES